MTTCPNCSSKISKSKPHVSDVCMLAAIAGVAQDRQEVSDATLAKLVAKVDADKFWELIGPVVDALINGDLE